MVNKERLPRRPVWSPGLKQEQKESSQVEDETKKQE